MTDAPTHETQIGFVKTLHDLIQTSQVHQSNHPLTCWMADRFCSQLPELTSDGEFSLSVWRGHLYLCGELLPYHRHAQRIIKTMTAYFTARALGGLRFLPGTCLQPEDFMTLIRLLDESVNHPDPPMWLNDRCHRLGFSWIVAHGALTEQQAAGLAVSERNYRHALAEQAQGLYTTALETVQKTAAKASSGRTGLRKARRLAQVMVDLIEEDPSLVLSLSTIKCYDDYTYTHSVNVALLATCLGSRIGLKRVSLEHLFLCGLFHDLGKAGVPGNILHKREDLDHAEWEEVHNHPLRSVQEILQLQAPQALRSKLILGPFEHHLNPDLSGYPQTHFMKRVSLPGRILRIADAYEALTAERIYRDREFNPDEALREMWQEGEKSFDPLLLKAFIHMMGVYPVGSIVELEDHRLGLVMDYPDPEERTRPLMMLLNVADSGEMTGGGMLNLALNVAAPGIRQCLHPSRLGLQVTELFLQDGPREQHRPA